MDCPVCRIASMRKVVLGRDEIDRCLSCGALWFDYGEIRVLSEGRLEAEEGPLTDGGERLSAEEKPAAGEKPGAFFSRMRRQGASLACPRCGGRLAAADFQMTGIPVFACPGCRGLLVPRPAAAALEAKFRLFREKAKANAALGAAIAQAERIRIEEEFGPPACARRGGPGTIPLPVIVPLSDDAPATGVFPVVTYILMGLSAFPWLLAHVAGASLVLPGWPAGLPAGNGFLNVPAWILLVSPFLHAGIVPLLTGLLFLFVLGDNVEDRMGHVPFAAFYLLCGACAGAAHVIWGSAGSPSALGSAGAVAGVLGAYLVFFPNVPIRMYGMGSVVSIPAYLFACVWVAAAFLTGPGPFTDLINPAPLSLTGSLAGFGAGLGSAVLWRVLEESSDGPALGSSRGDP